MLRLNTFAISGLLIIVTYIPLLILILTKGKNKLSRIYSLHIIAIFIWGIGALLLGINKKLEYADLIWKLAYVGVLFIPVFFYHAVHILTGTQRRVFLGFAYIQAILFVILMLSGKMFTSYHMVFGEFYYHRNTFLFPISFIFWEILIGVAHFDLIKFYKSSYPKTKEQLFPFIFAGIGFLGGTSNFLPGFGLNLYPYGNFLVPIHSFGVSYAILKHQLLDIEVAYKKSVSYSILFGIITLFYLLVVVSFEKLIQYYCGYTSPVISIVTAFIVGILFIPLRNKIQSLIDHLFFNTSHIEIIDENEKFRQEIAQTEKLKSIATFASGMAHEIKNPLTVIKTFTEYLPKKLNDKEFVEKFFPIVNKEVDRINELVHDLLEYSKPSPLVLKATNINKLINDTLDILNNQLIIKKINTIRELDEKNSNELLIDSKQIKQSFLNIFINAIDALPSGGYLRITTESQERKFIIKITDTGCGITREDLSHIFDPFFTKKENGTGLGLSITHGIITEHGGRILVESEVGRGTTFRIELPVRQDP
jgi:signal transduction histidine kinase